MPNDTHMTHVLKPLQNRRPYRGSRKLFYLIYFSSLFCLISMGWAAALFL